MYSALGNEYQVFPISRGRGLGTPPDAGPPLNTLAPSLSAEWGYAGTIVYCNAGEWLNTKYFLYQWYKGDEPIWGATEGHYTAKENDMFVRCAVTGYNSLGTLTVMSTNSFSTEDWVYERDDDILYDRGDDELRMRVMGLGMGMGLGMPWGGGGGATAGSIIGTETNGVSLSAFDDSMIVRDTVTPANAYIGSAVSKWSGNGAGTARASAAMMYLSSGLMEWAPENFAPSSGDLANATYWAVYNAATATLVADTGPLGEANSTEIYLPNINSQVYCTTVSLYATPLTASIWVKTLSGTASFRLVINDSGGLDQVSPDMTATTTWTRFFYTFPNPTYSNKLAFYWNSSGTPITVRVRNFQLGRGGTVHPYLPVPANSVSYGMRRDHDVRLNGKPGYLMETTRANIAISSNDLSNGSVWGPVGGTVIANQALGPMGTPDLDAFIPNAGSGNVYIGQSLLSALYSSSPYVFSAYVRNGTLGTNWMAVQITIGSPFYAWFNLATGVAGSTSVGATSGIIPLGGGLYRVWVKVTTPGTGGLVYFAAAPADGGGAVTGDGVKPAFYAGYMQMENANVVSSYIENINTMAGVLRYPDLPYFPNTAFNGSQTAGTLYCKFVMGVTVGWQELFSLGTNGNEDIIIRQQDTIIVYFIIDGGVIQLYGNVGAATTTFVARKGAMAFAAADFAYTTDGADAIAGIGTLPTTTNLYLGSAQGFTSACEQGWIQEALHLPRRSTNAEIKARTTI